MSNLANAGIIAHAVLTLTQILDILVDAGRLDAAKRQEVLAFLRKTS